MQPFRLSGFCFTSFLLLGSIEDDATEATVEDAEASIEDVEAKLEEAENSTKDGEAHADNQEQMFRML